METTTTVLYGSEICWYEVARILCRKAVDCMFELDIYTDGKEYRGVFHIGARQHSQGYGLPFILKTPAFISQDECLSHYVKEGLEHIDKGQNPMRPIDVELRKWIVEHLDQMEIGL